jgi:glycosyltransferase involved in cell wall biosynthesis
VSRRRVLLISHDPVGAEMAGLGIRTFELARVLAAHADVTVAHGGRTEGEYEGVRALPFRPHDPGPLRAPIAAADMVVSHPVWPVIGRWLRRSRARVVHDLYDPETLETLELFAGHRMAERRLLNHLTLDRLQDALRTGHHFTCASEKQRDLWLGALLASRMIDPARYAEDPTLRSSIDTVPFGIPAEPPQPVAGAGPRGRLVDADAELVLWNGGIWRWLDAETAIRAVALLAERRPRVRLLFMGQSEHRAARGATERAQTLARELGLLGRTVTFHASWVPYAERATWLLDADCALSTHHDHLETRFAFRTRILDCLWAGVPVVCTKGDDLADLVAEKGLGLSVPAREPAAVAAALEAVLDRGRASYAADLATAAAESTWPRAARALLRWLESEARPTRPGDAPGSAGPTLGQRARTAAYFAGGRALLARR